MWIAAKNGRRESGLTAFGQEGSRRCYTPQGGGITSSAQAHHNFPLATGIKPWECNAKRWLITKYCSVILLCILTRKITRITRTIRRTTPVIIKMISHVASCEDESVKKKKTPSIQQLSVWPKNTAVSHRSTSLAGRFRERWPQFSYSNHVITILCRNHRWIYFAIYNFFPVFLSSHPLMVFLIYFGFSWPDKCNQM